MSDEEIINLQAKIEKLIKRSKKLLNEIDTIRDTILNGCRHTRTEIKLSYVSGGYYHKSEYHTSTVCVLCGKVMKEDITYGSYQ